MGKKAKIINEWENVKKDFDEIKGDEKIIKDSWDKHEIRSLKLIYRLLKS